MAFIEKRGPYQWRVKICKKGFSPQTKTFSNKKNAEEWARMTVSEMERGIFISSSAAEFQPVFPEQYPQECQLCKTPTACEKFMVGGLKADTGCCVFICPRRHRKVAPSKSKIDANMAADSTPGASDFVTEKNKKILLLRAFLIPGPDEGGIPKEIRPRRKAQHDAVSSACSPPIFLPH